MNLFDYAVWRATTHDDGSGGGGGGVTLQSKTAIPTKSQQSITADTGFDGLDEVTVEPIPSQYVVPTGSLEITQNGNGIDVTDKATVNVNVSAPQSGVVPAGSIRITKNGTYDVTQYASAEVDTTASGIVFTEYNSSGFPTSAVVSGINNLPTCFASGTANTRIFDNIETLVVNNVYNVGQQAFEYWTGLKHITVNANNRNISFQNYVFRYNSLIEDITINGDPTFAFTFMSQGLKRLIINGNVRDWNNTFYGSSPPAVELYDFSKCTAVFTLSAVSLLPHATDCVIRVPQSLLTDWQNATNWCDLTDVVWEGV